VVQFVEHRFQELPDSKQYYLKVASVFENGT
jgi:hypothetical protein